MFRVIAPLSLAIRKMPVHESAVAAMRQQAIIGPLPIADVDARALADRATRRTRERPVPAMTDVAVRESAAGAMHLPATRPALRKYKWW